jgi:DNA-binding MarR family transcriptional regulator
MPRTAKTGAKTLETAASDLEHLLGYNLKRVYIIFVDAFRRAQADSGLSTRSFSTLALIVAAPGITQSEIARKLGIERSGLVAIIDDLQQRGYAMRVAVEGDRRVQALSPTGAGIQAFQSARDRLKVEEDSLISALSETERAQFRSLLMKIRNAHGGET